MNQVNLIGYLGNDAEIRDLPNGGRVANISLATSERWMKNGERMERTEWHRITIFGGVVGVIEKYTKKGSRIAITGKLRTRPWEDTNGLKHHTTEIIVDFDGRIELLDRPPNLDSAPAGEPVSDETINQLADGANQGATA